MRIQCHHEGGRTVAGRTPLIGAHTILAPFAFAMRAAAGCIIRVCLMLLMVHGLRVTGMSIRHAVIVARDDLSRGQHWQGGYRQREYHPQGYDSLHNSAHIK
jgi:hypothetical protein